MPPKPKKPVQSAKRIAQVKKAVPKIAAPKPTKPKNNMKKAVASKPPKPRKDMGKPGPLGQQNGTGSIYYQGPPPGGSK